MFYEIVIAPGYTEKGLEVLQGKSKMLRILEAKRSCKGMLWLRQVSGGGLAQESDDLTPEDIIFEIKSERVPKRMSSLMPGSPGFARSMLRATPLL